MQKLNQLPNLAIRQNQIPGSHLKPAESESLREKDWKPIFDKLPRDSHADRSMDLPGDVREPLT